MFARTNTLVPVIFFYQHLNPSIYHLANNMVLPLWHRQNLWHDIRADSNDAQEIIF